MGGRAIACLNSRDRNVLGFRRDLLTAAAYGVDEFLLVYGDRPESGRRSDDVTVRSMIDEVRDVRHERRVRGPAARSASASPPGSRPCRRSRRDADFVFAQISYSLDDAAALARHDRASTARSTPG